MLPQPSSQNLNNPGPALFAKDSSNRVTSSTASFGQLIVVMTTKVASSQVGDLHTGRSGNEIGRGCPWEVVRNVGRGQENKNVWLRKIIASHGETRHTALINTSIYLAPDGDTTSWQWEVEKFHHPNTSTRY